MLSTEERIEIVILMAKLESTAAVRQALQRRGVNVLSENTIRDTFKKFKETSSIHNRPKSERPALEDEKVEEISNFFENDPKTSLRFDSKKHIKSPPICIKT